MVVFSAVLFGIFASPIIKLGWGIIFLIMVCIELYFLLMQFFKSVIMLIKYRGISQPVPFEVIELAKKMGVRIKDFRIAEGMMNAYTTGEKVVIGSQLVEILEKDELLAVIAHEFAHIKESHLPLRLGAFIVVLFLGFMSFSNLPTSMAEYALLAYITIVLIPVNHWIEHRADRLAGEMVGCEPLKSALLKMSTDCDIGEPTESHPSIRQRVKMLSPS
jgi:Zn-dependent protease with chaperone function